MKSRLVTITKYISARLKERSTYTGIVLLLTASGIAVEPAMIEQIIPIGVGLASLIEILLADNKPVV